MTYRDELRDTIKPFITAPDAQGVVLAMLSSVRAVEQVMQGHIGDDVRVGVMQMFFDLTVGLNDNPFWRQHVGYLLPIFQMGANSWRDSFTHLADRDDRASNIAFMVSRNIICELAVAVLYCESGSKGLAEHSTALRKALMKQEGDA